MPEDNLRMKGILSLKAVITGTSPIKQCHVTFESLTGRALTREPYRESLERKKCGSERGGEKSTKTLKLQLIIHRSSQLF